MDPFWGLRGIALLLEKGIEGFRAKVGVGGGKGERGQRQKGDGMAQESDLNLCMT